MTRKRWTAIIVVAAVCCLPAFYLLSRPALQAAGEAALRHARIALGNRLTVGRLGVGFRTVHLRDVRYQDDRLVCEAPDVRIRYSLLRLLISRLNQPVRAVRGVHVERPTVTLRHRKSQPGSRPDTAGRARPSLPPLQHLTFTDGTLSAERATGQPIELTALEGEITLLEGGRLIVSADGQVGPEVASFRVLGDLAVGTWTGNASVELRVSDLASIPPAWLPGRMKLRSGEARVSLLFPNLTEWPEGTLEVAGAALDISGGAAPVRDLSLAARLEGDRMAIEACEGRAWEVPFTMGGAVTLSRDPSLALTITTPSIDLGTHLSPLTAKSGRVIGTGAAVINVSGPIRDPDVHGTFLAGHVSWGRLVVTDVAMDLGYEDGLIELTKLRATAGRSELVGTGEVDLRALPATFDLTLDAQALRIEDVAAAVGSAPISGIAQATCRVTGTPSAPRIHVTVAEADLDAGTVQLGRWKGDITFTEGDMTLSLKGPKMAISGRIQAPFATADLALDVDLAALQLPGQFTARGAFHVIGTPAVFEAQGQIGIARHGKAWQRLVTRIEATRTGDDLTYTLEGLPDPKSAPLVSDLVVHGEGHLRGAHVLNLEGLGGALTLDVRVAPDAERTLGGALRIRDLVAARLPSPLDNMPFLRGCSLDGSVEIGGPFWSPTAQGTLDLHGAGESGLTGRAAIDYGPDGWLADLDLREDADEIVTARGSGRPGKPIELELSGATRLAETFLGPLGFFRPDQLTGALSYTGQVRESPKGRRLEASILLTDGEAFGVPFDSLRTELAFDGREVSLHSARLAHGTTYRGWAAGSIPMAAAADGLREMDVQVELEGDVLSLVPRYLGLVRKANGQGVARLRMAGTYRAPVVGDFEAAFEGGRLWLYGLADELQGVRGRLFVEKGTRRLRLEGVEGRLRGKQVTLINGTPGQDGFAQVSEPMIAEGLGLLVGALGLETERDGVRLRVPAMMERGGVATIRLRGKQRGERLTIGGPAEAPVVRGVIVLSDTRVTYPFRETGEGDDDPLRDVQWDLDVVVAENVWYVFDGEFKLGKVAGTNVASMNAKILEGTTLRLRGSETKGDFWAAGSVEARQGRVSSLGMDFDIEHCGVNLDSKFGAEAMIYGRARKTVDVEGGFDEEIRLVLYGIDERTGARADRVRWSEAQLDLVSDNPLLNNSRDRVLAQLGLTDGLYVDVAKHALVDGTESYLLGPLLFRPFERRMKRALGLDVIRFSPMFARNLLFSGTTSPAGLDDGTSELALLQGSRLTVGEHLSRNFLVSYTSQLEAGLDQFQRNAIGLRHLFGLQYFMRRGTRFEFELERSGLYDHDDKLFRILHSFPF